MDTHALRQRTKHRRDDRAPSPVKDGAGGTAGVARRMAGRSAAVRALAVVAAGVLVCYGANRLGWWWATPLAGLAAGLWWRGRALAAFSVVVPSLAWGGDLFLQWTGDDLTRISKVTAGLAGLGNDAAWLGYVVTVAYAVLLCVAGAWLGAATRSVLEATRRAAPAAAATPTRKAAIEKSATEKSATEKAATEDREVGSDVRH